MRKVFSSNEVSEVILVRDALAYHAIEVKVLNEFSGTSAVPGFRPPAEVWVVRNQDYEAALKIVADTIATIDRDAAAEPWVCPSCGERNEASFEVCWSCQTERPGAHAPS